MFRMARAIQEGRLDTQCIGKSSDRLTMRLSGFAKLEAPVEVIRASYMGRWCTTPAIGDSSRSNSSLSVSLRQ